MQTFIVENYKIISICITLTSLVIAGVRFFSKKSKTDTSNSKVENTVHIHNNITSPNKTDEKTSCAIQKHNGESNKLLMHILFIDDEIFKVVKILKEAGWRNTYTRKDISDMDDPIVSSSHIIFVDVNGVGVKLGFKDQGIGLAGALKDKYPEKYIVIYSTETNGDMFNSNLKKVDYSLSKNVDPIEFIALVTDVTNKLN